MLGVGYLNREFTAYGLAAILLIEAADGTLFRRRALQDKVLALVSLAGVLQIVELLRSVGTPLGPGTSVASRRFPSGIEVVMGRTCWSWSDVPEWLGTVCSRRT